MRKIISLGLLALVLSSISTVLLASYPTCEADSEDLKEAGVYGWCNAWFDADTQVDKDRIAERIRERAAGYELDLSWLDSVSCPCWTPESLAAAVTGLTGVFCITDESKLAADVALFLGNSEVSAGYTIYPIDLAGGTECVLKLSNLVIGGLTNPGEDAVCRADVQALQTTVINATPLFPQPCI